MAASPSVALEIKFLDRKSSTPHDVSISKNKWRWSWMEEKDNNGDFYSSYVRKISDEDGIAWCLLCKKRVAYQTGGKIVFARHSKTDVHLRNRKCFKENHSLPAAFQATKDKIEGVKTIMPYGVAPNISSATVEDLRQNELPLQDIFVGHDAETLYKDTSLKKKAKQLVRAAYRSTGDYLLHKLPLSNPLLCQLSCLDPSIKGHSAAQKGMCKLFDQFKSQITADIDKDLFSSAVAQYHLNKHITPDTKRLDLWWAEVLKEPHYAPLKPVLKACLSIFTGPRVESSFSVMNNIITTKTNRMHINTYEAIHKIKYKILNTNKKSTQLYHRQDIIFSAVDQSLIFHMQTAHSRFIKDKPSKATLPRIPKIGDRPSKEASSVPEASTPALVQSTVSAQRQIRQQEKVRPKDTVHASAKPAKKKPCKMDIRTFFGGK
ncbi:hypothetical protein ElyMa_006306400 [Elysia marginata]|uniref:HAT C-terminal dimerisation domain-containing protein n=1 Tax=Elysia marginata TaxID=1093978 RepID=A0AAV4HF20_9GAST|nr:hypothetical protein ElyMa_006306400 [Elysia marginata]